MKKALQSIVLLGAVTGVAHAETAVQLYGIVDGGLQHTTTKTRQGDAVTTKSVTGIKDNNLSGSRWGLKGSEDLGNGTSAIFKLESGFSLGTGASGQGGRLFGRTAVIGLKGDDWGTLTVGRQTNVADEFMDSFDAFGVSLGQAGADSSFGDSLGSRMDASVKYMSPELAGFRFGLAYAGNRRHETVSRKGEKESESRDASNWISTGLSYENGPFAIGASFDRFRVNTVSGNTDSPDGIVKTTYSSKTWNIGASYDFEVVKLHALYGEIRGRVARGSEFEYGLISDVPSPTYLVMKDPGAYRQKAWAVGLSAPVSDSGKLMFSYQGSKVNNTALDRSHRNSEVQYKEKIKIFSVGYTHDLSKRTTAYASFSVGKGKSRFPGQEERYNLKSTQTLIGLRHRF